MSPKWCSWPLNVTAQRCGEMPSWDVEFQSDHFTNLNGGSLGYSFGDTLLNRNDEPYFFHMFIYTCTCLALEM